MIRLTLIAVGNLKEPYLKEAFAEYEKRLSAFCKFELIQIKEQKLPDDPSQKEIDACLFSEGREILSALPQKAYKIALCVEGKQFSSPAFAEKLEEVAQGSSEIALVIGSSYGLSSEVKETCDLRLSVSDMTFPHQLLRVMLMEILYRAFQIQRGSRYHK